MYYRIHCQHSTIIQRHKHESSATIPTLKISFYPFVKFLCFWESIVQSVQWIALYETISLCRGTTDNKHCEILVSCSDKERNCLQAHETACKVIELHESSGNCMQAQGTACNLM